MPSTRLTRLKRLRLKLEIDRPTENIGKNSVRKAPRAEQPSKSPANSMRASSRLSLRRAAMRGALQR